MGGNAFGLGQIQRQDVSDTLTAFIENFHSENTLGLVGSAMKKSISSDIDVVISNSNLNRNSLYEYLHSNFDASRIKRTGAAEHVMFPIYKGCTPTNDLIQFDVFLVDNIKNAQWLMGDIHRNLLLAMFARRMSDFTGLKRTIKFPGGLAIKWPSGDCQRKSDPFDIMAGCGLKSILIEETDTFESLVNAIMCIDDEIQTFRKLWLCDWEIYAHPISGRPGFKNTCKIIRALI